jgi:hypothetical protein
MTLGPCGNLHSETVNPKRRGRKRDGSAALELNHRDDALRGTVRFTSDGGPHPQCAGAVIRAAAAAVSESPQIL